MFFLESSDKSNKLKNIPRNPSACFDIGKGVVVQKMVAIGFGYGVELMAVRYQRQALNEGINFLPKVRNYGFATRKTLILPQILQP